MPAYDIGPRIGIEGEKEFKNSIKAIDSEIRALQNQLRTLSKEYDENDRSVEGVTKKQNALNQAIETSRKRIDLLTSQYEKQVQELKRLEDALEQARKENGEGSTEAQRAEAAYARQAKTVNDRDPVGQTILHLMEHGVAAVNMHTNLDSAPGGVNDVLAEALGLKGIGVLAPAGKDEQGRPYGLGRYGTLETDCTLPDFLERVKTALHCDGVRYADGGKPVHKVAVGGGACGEFIKTALALGCDTFVTADLKYNQFADARDLGLNLIDAGHYPTENLVCETMARYLETRFPDLEILRSSVHEDVVKFG